MLRIEGLRRRVGRFALRVDELRVDRGDYVVLLGPSGAGKTMLLETIAGLHSASGRVWIDDREVSHLPPETRGVGLVYQDCWLFPHLSVRENIDFGRRYYRGAPGSSTDELAAMLHIFDLLARRPPTLSGGERQRVALARALAIRPQLLLLDEPLGPLDPTTRERVAAELRNCHAAMSMTTIHVTHDHTEARMMGDAVAVIRGGRLDQFGPTHEVFYHPRTAELARFLGCENVLDCEAAPADSPDRVEVRLTGQPPFRIKSPVRGRARLCVRPEELRLVAGTAEPGGGITDILAARFHGHVVDISSRGPLVRIEIQTGPQRWVSLMGAGEFRSARYAVGDPVGVEIPAEAVHLIAMS
jgi:molybdate transport system ATP-binding protein/molybdate/tungstate transport system ATP-binding protein